jgi:Zn-dependent protease with chaperone function
MPETITAALPIRARWFNGRSSRPREVLVALSPGPKGPTLQLHVLDLPHAASRTFQNKDVEWPPRWSEQRAPERLTVALRDHGSVEIDDPTLWQQALVKAGARPSLVQRMQLHWHALLITLIIAVGILGAFYRWGTPWLAVQLTRYVPVEWELSVSEKAFGQIDHAWLKPSQLPTERQQALRHEFDDMRATIDRSLKRYPNYTPRYQLLFRRGRGPNAFALPGGTLVMTDELVEVAAKNGLSDDALIGVLAHEIGHVEHRHGTRLIVEQGVLNVGVGLVLGDVSSVVSLAGTTLTTLAYRRQHEEESDCYALALMARLRRSTVPMADLLLVMSKGRTPEADKGQAPKSSNDWLSTHPDTPGRAERLKSGQLCGR